MLVQAPDQESSNEALWPPAIAEEQLRRSQYDETAIVIAVASLRITACLGSVFRALDAFTPKGPPYRTNASTMT